MTLTVRSATVTGATTKGSALTHAELDENFNHLSQASNHSFTPSGSGAVAETVASRLGRTLFISDYMSAADRTAIAAGTTTTIDTAVSNAHGALPSTGGEIVFPPFAGKYKLTAAPTFTKRVVLRGMGATAVTAAGTGSTVILKDATATAAILSLSVDGCAVQDLEVEGEGGNTGDGIEIKAGRCRLSNVSVYSMGNDGIRIGTAAGSENCNFWRLNNVKSKSNGRDGIRIEDAGAAAGSANANGGLADGLDLQSNTGSGLKLGNAQLNTFIGVVTQSNTANGIHLAADADNNVFFGGDPEQNTNKDILIDAGATENRFYGIPVNASTVTDNGTRTLLFIADTLQLPRGLKFPATQVASSDANTLDDYEEGTWTPAVTFATPGDVSVAYSTQSGRYTKVGRKVTCEFQIITSSFTHGTAAGNFRITGLPFNVGHDTTGSILASGWTLASVSNLVCYGLSGAAVLQIYASRSAAATVVTTTAHWASGGSLLLYGNITFTV
jgi:hypothetical protein